jgi:hypothetical protein
MKTHLAGVASASPACATGVNRFRLSFFYNYRACGDWFQQITLKGPRTVGHGRGPSFLVLERLGGRLGL